jgi:hypothetical protein
MKVLIIYRPNSEHGRLTEEFIHDFQRRNPSQQLEVLNIDSRAGSATATLYDVTDYPTILVLQSDGQLEKSWGGDNLPRLDEVASYARL